MKICQALTCGAGSGSTLNGACFPQGCCHCLRVVRVSDCPALPDGSGFDSLGKLAALKHSGLVSLVLKFKVWRMKSSPQE